MDGMSSRKRTVDGKPTSLCDLGYCDVGLDDNWQACGTGDGTNFHAADGTPLVNKNRFPDLYVMTSHAHSLGLTAGWYGNNCICAEKNTSDIKYYQGDVNALVGFGFDGVKLDGCGVQTHMQTWYDLINATGRPITIENCHWGSKWPFAPTHDWCPWNFYRTSPDVKASYGSVLTNLQSTIPYALANLSRPGCWAYPDMLEVGCSHGPHGPSDPGLTPSETRSHFAAWSIVSSPLTLSHDINNDTVMDQIWPLIANPEIIAVNQAYYGHSGSPFVNSSEVTTLSASEGQLEIFNYQYFYKPIDATRTAVLLMNHLNSTQDLVLNFADVPHLPCGTNCEVRCLFWRKDLGSFSGQFVASGIAPHDSGFFMLSTPVALSISN